MSMILRRNSTSQIAAAWIAASFAACAEKAVDVGHNAGLGAPVPPSDAAGLASPVDATAAPARDAGDPFVIVHDDGQIPAFAASDGHVFWFSVDSATSPGDSVPFTTGVHLRSCETADCVGTRWSTSVLQVHDGGSTRIPTWIYVNDTRVFWPSVDEGRGTLFYTREDPNVRGSLGVDLGPPGFAADDDRAYFDGTIACDIVDCLATESRPEYATPLGPTPFTGAPNIVVDGDYLYMANQDIVRARKDGTGTIQLIAARQNGYALAVHDGQVYWVDRAAHSSVYRCPVDGCNGDPAVAIADLKFPSALVVDDENVYVIVQAEDPNVFGGQIVRCARAGCAEPTLVVTGGVVADAVFVDSQFVYFSGLTCDGARCAGTIAAVSK